MKFRGRRGLGAIAALLVAACGSTAPDVGRPVAAYPVPAGLAMTVGLCAAYLYATVSAEAAPLGALGDTFDAEAPPGVVVALETLVALADSADPSVDDEFSIDEAWGTIGGFVKPQCRDQWRVGASGASSPLDTATAFATALRSGDVEQMRALGAANVVASLEALAGTTVDLGPVTTVGFELLFEDAAASCVFYEGFVDDCTRVG